MELVDYDLSFCVRKLPKELKILMMSRGRQIVVAGGFIRAVIAGEKVSDVDVFAGNKEDSYELARKLDVTGKDIYQTKNAMTVKNLRYPVQFIHRWVYSDPLEVLNSFDFTICQAAIWFDKEKQVWLSRCDLSFYSDLAAKRLVYLSPTRDEEAGGSLLRVLKYYQRGYRIPLDSLGKVLARLSIAVRDTVSEEKEIAKVLTSLLVEVDPDAFVRHELYLPEKLDEKEGVR